MSMKFSVKNIGLIILVVGLSFGIYSITNAETKSHEAETGQSPATSGGSPRENKDDFNKRVEAEVSKRLPKELEEKLKKFSPENFAILSREILEKEQTLREKEKEVRLKEEQVKISEEQLSKKVVDFELRQQKFIGCVDKIEAEQKTRIDKIVEVVANMRPQTAADLLSVQEPSLSVQILSRLASDKSSKIFNLMNKEISAKLQKLYLDMKQ